MSEHIPIHIPPTPTVQTDEIVVLLRQLVTLLTDIQQRLAFLTVRKDEGGQV